MLRFWSWSVWCLSEARLHLQKTLPVSQMRRCEAGVFSRALWLLVVHGLAQSCCSHCQEQDLLSPGMPVALHVGMCDKGSFLPNPEEEACFKLAVLKSLMLQWLTILKNILCFIWLLSFLDGFSVKTVSGMLYNPLSGSWSWMESTGLNYAMHAVKAGAWAQSHATDTPPETGIQQHSATAGTAGTVPDGTVWHGWWWTVTRTENELLLRWTQ